MSDRRTHTRTMVVLLVAALTLGLAACSSSKHKTSGDASDSASSARGSDGALVGLFKVAAGQCDAGAYHSGSYFRMVMPGGTAKAGPFFQDPDSTCGDKSYILMTPGTDGGLITGGFQPRPATPFDDKGDSLSGRIIAPQGFTGISFSISSNAVDPQTNQKVPAPEITNKAGALSGQTEALVGEWNKQVFNQGSPKPDGSRPGITAAVSGLYDASTGFYEIEWASQIVGGPFNDFTGVWHLEGTFVPKTS